MAKGKLKPHGNPAQDGITDAERCVHCGRWIRLERIHTSPDSKYEVKFYNQINWDAQRGFYYISRANHNVKFCGWRKEDREREARLKGVQNA